MTGPRRSSGAGQSVRAVRMSLAGDVPTRKRAPHVSRRKPTSSRTQVSFLEEEIATLRRRLTDSPRHVRILEDRLAAAQAQLSSVVGPEREARVHPARGAGPDPLAEGGGRPAGAAAERLRHLPRGLRRRGHGRRLHPGPQDAGRRVPGRRSRRAAPWPGGHAQRGAQRRPGARPSSAPARSCSSRRSSTAATGRW